MSPKMGRKGFCCFLWLGFMCGVVRCQICPRAVDISPCTCKQNPMPSTTTCANITSTNTLHEVLRKSLDFPFFKFVLNNSNIMYLPASSTANKKFQRVLIQNTAMVTLFDGQPGKTDTLVYFQLNNVRLLRGIEWNFFSSFTNLSWVEINNMEVKKLGQEFKDNIYKGLKRLVVSNAKTTVLEDGVFDELPKLEWLEITYAKISFLKRTVFPKPSKLFLMNFNGNLLTTLPPDIFDNMPSLHMVFLSNNQFTTLSEDIFMDFYMRPAITLDVSGNPIICDCRMSWFLPRVRSQSIYGRCVEPPSMKDKSFTDMTEEDFSYCYVT